MPITLKLGKLPKLEDKRTLRLSKYMEVPKAPPVVSWHDFKPVSDWGMCGNDIYGNCVIATAAHIIDCAKANESQNYHRILDEDVIRLSMEMGALDGYYILTRLKRWRKQGMWGSFILSFVDIEPIDDDYLKAAIYMFGHADIGLWMPAAWEHSNFWDVGSGPEYVKGGWGGHSVPLLGYYESPDHGLVYYACTWGRIIEITAKAIAAYCDEAWVSVLKDWFASDNIAPSGFNAEQMQRDIIALD